MTFGIQNFVLHNVQNAIRRKGVGGEKCELKPRENTANGSRHRDDSVVRISQQILKNIMNVLKNLQGIQILRMIGGVN